MQHRPQSLLMIAIICLMLSGTARAVPSPSPSSSPSPAPSAVPTTGSAFAPVVLQGCSRHVTGNGSIAFPYKSHFDLSFQNISTKTANAVLVHIGGSDFVKTGEFAPNAVASWRIDASSFGTFEAQNCAIKAVRFTDGSEWDAPPG